MTDFADSSLKNWDDIKSDFRDAALLIGNGQSIAVSTKFEELSLFEAIDSHLRPELRKLFDELETASFEGILGSLLVAEKVTKTIAPMAMAGMKFRQSYDQIKNALIGAIHRVHIGRSELSDELALAIGEELSRYRWVYSTNYDLIVYWSLIHWAQTTRNLSKIKDHFRLPDDGLKGNLFEMPEHSWQGSDVTEFFFLHGALHLFQLPSGVVGKLVNQGQQILDQFYDYPVPETLPLFVSEGDADKKRKSIRDSSYLEYAFSRFERHEGSLVIFGHALGDQDRHIRCAISKWKNKNLAISINNRCSLHVIQRRSEYTKYFPGVTIQFFDAKTHPLGSMSMGHD